MISMKPIDGSSETRQGVCNEGFVKVIDTLGEERKRSCESDRKSA